MSSSIASSLLRRTLRRPLPSPLLVRLPCPMFYTSLASSPLTRTLEALQPSFIDTLPWARRFERPSSLLLLRLVSSKVQVADDKLTQVIDTEIDCAKEEQTLEVTLPDVFPFEIIDNPGDQTITLKREFVGEKIEAIVFVNTDEVDDAADGEGDEDDAEEDDKEDAVQPTISLVVTIDKGESSLLEFCCSLSAGEEFTIESMKTKKRDDPDNQDAYQGPEFSELDEKLQKALYKYLEARGIKNSLFDFLNAYMLNKDQREYLTWLKNMKKFIQV